MFNIMILLVVLGTSLSVAYSTFSMNMHLAGVISLVMATASIVAMNKVLKDEYTKNNNHRRF